jgi:hypothetical protein
MKKSKLFLVAFAIGTLGLFANNEETPSVSKDEIRKQIIELLETSTTDVAAEISVNITFTFNTEGEIVVLKVASIDKEILNFVRENVNGQKIENPGKVKRQYTMPISIVTK